MTEFNLDLGKKALEQITLNPETHHQSDAQSCVLGWTKRLANKSWHCLTTEEAGPQLLGISPSIGWFIYACPSNRMARMILAHLVAKEERVDRRRQRDIDRQARAQVRAVYALVEQERRSQARLKTPV